MNKTRIIIADDHGIIRDGLSGILSKTGLYDIVAEAKDGQEAMILIDKHLPDVVLLDISMPNISGIEVARDVKKFHPKIKIIILSRHDNMEYARELLSMGVEGYVIKDELADDIKKALQTVLSGQNYLSPKLTTLLIENYRYPHQKPTVSDSPFSKLTSRERQILKLLAEGKSRNEISSKLFISPNTVKVHKNNIMKKLNINNIVEMVVYAIKHGFIEK